MTLLTPWQSQKCEICREWLKVIIVISAICESKLTIFWENVEDASQSTTRSTPKIFALQSLGYVVIKKIVHRQRGPLRGSLSLLQPLSRRRWNPIKVAYDPHVGRTAGSDNIKPRTNMGEGPKILKCLFKAHFWTCSKIWFNSVACSPRLAFKKERTVAEYGLPCIRVVGNNQYETVKYHYHHHISDNTYTTRDGRQAQLPNKTVQMK